MCVSELCSNAITHSASGQGGVFIVEVGYPREGIARVAVTDEGGASVPAAGTLDLMAEGGRGLALVAACTRRWGYADAYPGRTVWAEASWPVPVPSPGQDAPAAARRRSAVPPVTGSARSRSSRSRLYRGRPWSPPDPPPGPAA